MKKKKSKPKKKRAQETKEDSQGHTESEERTEVEMNIRSDFGIASPDVVGTKVKALD